MYFCFIELLLFIIAWSVMNTYYWITGKPMPQIKFWQCKKKHDHCGKKTKDED